MPRAPLDPKAIESELRARSLSDPRLRDRCVERLALPDEPWPPRELDLALLTLAAWCFRPELAVARAEVAAAEAKVETAGTPANPALTLTPGRVPGGTPSAWFFAASLDFVIPTAGKLGKREAIASQEVELAALDAAVSAWRLYAGVRDALIDAEFAERALAMARRELELRGELLEWIDARLRAGAASATERLAFAIEADRARFAVSEAQAALSGAWARLAAACGLASAELEGRTLVAPEPWVDLDASPDELGLLDRLDLLRGLAEYERAERALELELAKQVPDLTLGPGYEYDQGTRKYLLDLGLELPLFDRNQGPIAEAVAQRAAVAARFEELESQALGAIDLARAELAASEARLAAIGDVGSVQERRDAARRAFEIGSSDRATLAQAELELLFVEGARVDAERQRAEAVARLEDALQRPLDPRVEALSRAEERSAAHEEEAP